MLAPKGQARGVRARDDKWFDEVAARLVHFNSHHHRHSVEWHSRAFRDHHSRPLWATTALVNTHKMVHIEPNHARPLLRHLARCTCTRLTMRENLRWEPSIGFWMGDIHGD